MKTKYKILASSVVAALLFSACSSNEPMKKENMGKQHNEIKMEAMKAIKVVGGSLQKTLKQKAKEGGLVGAAKFCAINATDLSKEVSKTLPKGVKVRRITDKPRNPNNEANAEQLAVFDEIKAKMKNGEDVKMLVKQKSENHYQVYKPIMMKGKCLNCHGTDSVRKKKAYDIISKEFPNDKAVNYKKGDFRGAFIVDIVK